MTPTPKAPSRGPAPFSNIQPTGRSHNDNSSDKPSRYDPLNFPDNRHTRRAIRFKRVREIVPLGPSRIYELIAVGEFPRPFVLIEGGRAKAFWEHEIYEWLEQRAAEGRE